MSVRISEKTRELLTDAQALLSAIEGKDVTFGDVVQECVSTWLQTGIEVCLQDEDSESKRCAERLSAVAT